MSWLLKQAEDILNRVDQQTNAAINQHGTKSTPQQTAEESATNTSLIDSATGNSNSSNRLPKANRHTKKKDDSHLIDFLNSSTSVDTKPNRPISFNHLLTDATRTASVPDMFANQSSKTAEKLSSKSASGTPRSITPHDEDQGLVLVRTKKLFLFTSRVFPSAR